MMLAIISYEPHHAKRFLKSLVVVIPKKGWVQKEGWVHAKRKLGVPILLLVWQ